MRTLPYGNSFRDHSDGFKRTAYQTWRTVADEREPEGDEMPVFERAASGYRGEYERPWRYDEDGVSVRRIKRR
ncbi:MAG: hypothetical protein EOQ89_03590 [Mesorhizobium sp.]|nr:MAG: hypothetical protein EOQ89_03590 [Mesorhizobium sp.]